MNRRTNTKRDAGFSLIELMIVVAIIGLIAAIALPSYSSYLNKTRRVDGLSFLTEVASEQVRFYSEYNRYTDDMSDLGFGNAAAAVSDEGYYNVSASIANGGNTYLLTATPIVGQAQENDEDCLAMSISSSGQKTITGSTSPENCF